MVSVRMFISVHPISQNYPFYRLYHDTDTMQRGAPDAFPINECLWSWVHRLSSPTTPPIASSPTNYSPPHPPVHPIGDVTRLNSCNLYSSPISPQSFVWSSSLITSSAVMGGFWKMAPIKHNSLNQAVEIRPAPTISQCPPVPALMN